MPSRLLTVKEAAALLGEHPNTTRRRLRETTGKTRLGPGDLIGVKLGTGPRARWRVSEKAVEACIGRSTA